MSAYLRRYKNCSLLRDHQLVNEDLWVRNGQILSAQSVFFEERLQADTEYDCHGAIISPGLIDIQINGGFGIDFALNDQIEEGMQIVSKGLLSCGVTSFCPTIVTSPKDSYHKILHRVQRTETSTNGAGILGLHMEGPFINPEKKGAHPADLIRRYDNGFQDVIDMYGTLSNVSLLTLAPELTNSNRVIHELKRRGVKVSLGHSAANLSQGQSAVKAGACFITHLFNAMMPFHHRDPHLVGLLVSDPPIYYGLIADNIHTHPAAMTIAYRVNPRGLILVSDAIGALGLSPGIHTIGQHKVQVGDGKAVLAGTDTLAGSICPLNEGVKIFREATGCSVVESLEAATLHPAQLLGKTERKGTLEPGTDADFVVWGRDMDLIGTFTAGELAWSRNDFNDWVTEI